MLLFFVVFALRPGFAAAQAPAEVAVSIDRWGAGNVIRRGDMAALRVVLTDLGTRQRELLIRIETRDADGDRPVYQSVVAGNPGTEQRLWMYLRVPITVRNGDPFTVTVHEAVEDPAAPAEIDPAGRGVRPGRLLARVPLAPQRVAEPYEGLLGVVGRSPNPSISLYGMASAAGAFGEEWAPLAHERLVQVMLTPQELPDRWFGLSPFEAMLWLEGSPADLTPDAAIALKEWVSRGGHLVIIQPTAGQAWTSRDGSAVAELMPAVRIIRNEGVSLEPYRALLTDSATLQLSRSAVLHTFEPLESAAPADAMRVLTGPTGDCVVVRRLVGAGAVTLIGIDINSVALRSIALPQPERFWNRVLGLRGLRPPAAEIDRLTTAAGGALRQRTGVWVDEDIPDLIARQSRATAGVLLGFVVFVAYWILAGPGGYALLKHFKLQRHAWLAYFAAGLAFTGIAWGGATLLRPKDVSATHFTILDHVYGQPVQRARSWMSVLLPTYGRSAVSVLDADAPAAARTSTARDTIVPWEARSSETGLVAMFPDATTYTLEARQPSLIAVPARATIKQFQSDWSGGPRWGMPRPVAPEGEPADSARLHVNARSSTGSRPGEAVSRASGLLVHELPAPLESVIIIVVEGQRRISLPGNATSQNFFFPTASAFRLTSAWEPGQVLDLARATEFVQGREPLIETFLADILKGQVTAAGYRKSAEDRWSRIVAQALFPVLAPPDLAPGPSGQPFELGRRWSTHGWDLGRWFTQPCIIVLGQMGADRRDAPSPVPLAVDGRAIDSAGRTVIRWVYPLPDLPPVYAQSGETPLETEPTPDNSSLQEPSPEEG